MKPLFFNFAYYLFSASKVPMQLLMSQRDLDEELWMIEKKVAFGFRLRLLKVSHSNSHAHLFVARKSLNSFPNRMIQSC